jgi:TetR/AcrR family transcriptional regulator, cholesterol catabolism regulator
MPRRKATDFNGGGGRREEIILTAAKLFRKQGFNGTSIIEIAREVGLPKGSIYNYAKSKEDLLYEIITLGIRAVLPEMRKIVASNDSVEDKFRRIVYVHALSLTKHHDFISIFFQDKNSLSSEHYKEYMGYRSEVGGHFKKIIEQGITEGVFRKADVTLQFFAVLGMCNWMTQWYDAEGRLSSEQIATFFSDTAMRMVGP